MGANEAASLGVKTEQSAAVDAGLARKAITQMRGVTQKGQKSHLQEKSLLSGVRFSVEEVKRFQQRIEQLFLFLSLGRHQ